MVATEISRLSRTPLLLPRILEASEEIQDHFPGAFLLANVIAIGKLDIYWNWAGFGTRVPTTMKMPSYSAAQFGKLTQVLEQLNLRDWPGAIEVCDWITSTWPHIPEAYEYRSKAWKELGFCYRRVLDFETQRGGDPEILKILQTRLDECETSRVKDEETAKNLRRSEEK